MRQRFMADVTAGGCPALQNEAKPGRRMQYINDDRKRWASIFFGFLFDPLNNLP